MKNVKGIVMACLLSVTGSLFAQKDILLYETNFSAWDEVTEAQGNAIGSSGSIQGKDGFVYTGKPTVNPTAGTICALNSTNYLEFPSFDFISGGAIEVELVVGKNGKYFNLDATAGTIGTVTYKIDEQPAAAKDLGTDGTSFKTGKNYGKYVVTASFTGSGAIKPRFTVSGKCGEIAFKSIKVYSGVGTTPYVCAPDYPNAGADGSKTEKTLMLKGQIGGESVAQTLDLKGYNITGDAALLIEGADAARFTLTNATVSGASLSTGNLVPVEVLFNPSVKASNSSALLKITPSDAGSQPYYVHLTGVTGSGLPQIVASASPLNFWTSYLAATTQKLSVSGLNLTGPITATIQGGEGRFTLSSKETATIPLASAIAGTELSIEFTGNVVENTLNATLVLSSPGATDVEIPLAGITSATKPLMYPLTFDVSPSGTAYVEVSPGGTSFLAGTQVSVKVTLEKGYKVKYWQDATGNTRSERVFKVSEKTNTMSGDPITVFTELGQQQESSGEVVVTDKLVALKAENITTNSFTATWTTQQGNTTGYDVTVKDASGNVVQSLHADALATSIEVTGLQENTDYYYNVTGTGDDGTGGQASVTTPTVGRFRTSKTAVTKVCGDDNYNNL